MEWPSWNKNYDNLTYMPRIAIKCGHSLWEKCIRKIILRIEQGHGENCPECYCSIQYDAFIPAKDSNIITEDYIQNIMKTFPKNLALLKSIELDQSPNAYLEETELPNSDAINNSQSEKYENIPRNDEYFWEIHPQKPIEAFCVEDKVLLWLECILSNNHRSHEISSTTHGYSLQKGELEELKYLSDDKLKQLSEGKDRLQRELLNLIDFDKKRKSVIDECFQKIMDVIEQTRLEEQFKRQDDFGNKKNNISTNLVSYSNSIRELNFIQSKIEELEHEPEIEFLRSFNLEEMSSLITNIKVKKYQNERKEQIDETQIIK